MTRFISLILRKGASSKDNLSGALLLAADELPVDLEASNTGGIYDFIVYGLPTPGQSARVVLPQRNAIGDNALYRKYNAASTWVDFTLDDDNSVSSSRGEPRVLPTAKRCQLDPRINIRSLVCAGVDRRWRSE